MRERAAVLDSDGVAVSDIYGLCYGSHIHCTVSTMQMHLLSYSQTLEQLAEQQQQRQQQQQEQ